MVFCFYLMGDTETRKKKERIKCLNFLIRVALELEASLANVEYTKLVINLM